MAETIDLSALKERLQNFAQVRNWEKFHSPKNLAMAMSVEAAELVEIFQWLKEDESYQLSENQRQAVKHEVADVIIYLIRMCSILDINIAEAVDEKILLNGEKYPE